MDNEPLSFKYNSCRVDVMVAGCASEASGFIYLTKPGCSYDYVFTAKHAFQEECEQPKVEKIANLELRWMVDSEELTTYKVNSKNYATDILFFDDYDMVIIKIPKQRLPRAKRIVVKNLTEVARNVSMESHAFLNIHRNENTLLRYDLNDQEKCVIQTSHVKDVQNYKGISGCGVYSTEFPYLLGIMKGFRMQFFEQDEMVLAMVNWDKINDILHSKGWTRLNRGDAKKALVTEDKEIIDVRELNIKGAILNMERAVNHLRHDMTDDWYFDPLHYVDMCNIKFVLNYFSRKSRRDQYVPQEMEIFYLPKKSFVLRKAMVGTFVDRLVYTAVVNELGPVIDKHLSKFVYSARYNIASNGDSMIVQGVEQWTKMKYLIHSWAATATDGCLVRLDLLNYYDTINKQMLVRLLKEIVDTENEKACVNLLELLLKRFAKNEEGHGIPQNSDASSLLASFYLSHIDEFIQAKALHYCRFMDDMYFIAKNIYEARNLLQVIEKHLRAIDLSVNAQKVQFIKLDNPKEKDELIKELSCYDHRKIKIKQLIKSDVKARRMNAIALLMEELKIAVRNFDKERENERDRALKFSANALSSYKLELESNWSDFYKKLKDLTCGLVDTPDQTPLLCRLIAAIRKGREMDEVKEEIAALVLREKGSIYEWQAYHLWMLLAHLKYETPKLVKYAAEEIEKNDETKTVEVAAIFIYMVTINPEYSRLLLHRLRDGQLHGNMQKRCALIAMRGLDPQVIDQETIEKLCEPLVMCHNYLNEHKDKPLVFFHHISSHLLSTNKSVLYPEYYSGL